jgi:hypothetical protein
VKPVLQLPTSTATQAAATTPTKAIVPAASTSTKANIQQLVSASTGGYVPASSASTEANKQQLVSASTGVSVPVAHQHQLRPTCSKFSHHQQSLCNVEYL